MLIGTTFISSPVEKCMTKKPSDEELTTLNEYTSAVATIAVISKELITNLFKRNKELGIKIDPIEKLAWNKIKDGAGTIDNIIFNNYGNDYKKFKNGVLMVKFLMLELISRCDDSDLRVWQFHNLLKTFKVVYPSIVPDINAELEAFSALFGQSENQTESS